MLYVLHLSDIHLNSLNRDAIKTKFTSCFNRISSELAPKANLLICISGDLVFDGDVRDYYFLWELLDVCSKHHLVEKKNILIHWFFSPGNHDCKFVNSDSIRQRLLKSLREDSSTEIDDALINIMTSPQDGFFRFLSDCCNQSPLLGLNRLVWSNEIILNDHKIMACSINSAWLSEVVDRPGNTYIPSSLIESKSVPCDLSIGLCHHPYGWMSTSKYRRTRDEIERTFDVIFCGHEHEFEEHIVFRNNSSVIMYISAGAFHSDDSPTNGTFNLLEVDLKNKNLSCKYFAFSNGQFISRGNEPFDYGLSRAKKNRSIVVNPVKYEEILDLGVTITERDIGANLPDVFVYPCLWKGKQREITDEELIPSGQVFYELEKSNLVIIEGAEYSGKTSLGKMLFYDYYKNGANPILASGSQFANWRDVSRIVTEIIDSTYLDCTSEAYVNVPEGEKVLVVDDIDDVVTFHAKRYLACVSNFAKFFDKVIFIGQNIANYDFALSGRIGSELLGDFSWYRISEFNTDLRAALVDKWYRIEYFDRDELLLLYKKFDNIVDGLVGKDGYPAYPIFILAIAEMVRAGAPMVDNNITYGDAYDFMIRNNLERVAGRPETGIAYKSAENFFSEIAFAMHKASISSFDRKGEFAIKFIKYYNEKYGANIEMTEAISLGRSARVLSVHDDNSVQFWYPYVFYSFLAKAYCYRMAEISASEKVRQEVSKMLSKIDVESNYALLKFILFYTSDTEIIRCLVGECLEFNKITPLFSVDPLDADLFTRHDYNEYNECKESGSGAALVPATPNGSNTALTIDLAHAEGLRKEPEDASAEKQLINNLAQSIDAINQSIKYVQLVGYALKAGRREFIKSEKLALVRCAYTTAMKVVNILSSVLIEQRLGFMEFVLKTSKKDFRIFTPEEFLDQVNEFFYRTQGMFYVAMLVLASKAVGSEELQEIYNEIEMTEHKLSFGLFRVQVELQSYRHHPLERVKALLRDELKKDEISLPGDGRYIVRRSKNDFIDKVLQTLIYRNITLYPRHGKATKELCSLVGIPYDRYIKDRTRLELTGKKISR